MTKPTRTPTVEEYMSLVKEGDSANMMTFLAECFGTGDDYLDDLAQDFAKEVLPTIQEEIENMINNAPEATTAMSEAMNKAVEAKEGTVDAVLVEKKEGASVEAAAVGTAEVKESEAPGQG